jgi:hypothetical protein
MTWALDSLDEVVVAACLAASLVVSKVWTDVALAEAINEHFSQDPSKPSPITYQQLNKKFGTTKPVETRNFAANFIRDATQGAEGRD